MTQEPIEARQQTPLDDTAELVERQIDMLVKQLGVEMKSLAAEQATGRDIGKLLGELNTALSNAMKVKERLDHEQRKQAGIAHGDYALDLDRSRAHVTRCLGRLVPCCKA